MYHTTPIVPQKRNTLLKHPLLNRRVLGIPYTFFEFFVELARFLRIVSTKASMYGLTEGVAHAKALGSVQL